MKLKKWMFAVTLVAALVGFTGCGENPAGTPEPEDLVESICFYDADGNKLDYESCDTNVDPTKLAYIDITFTVPMDKERGGLYSVESKTYQDGISDLYSVDWVNQKILRLIFYYVRYNGTYSYLFSNPEGESDFYILKSDSGIICKNFYVEFSTIKYKRTTPNTFELDVAGKEGGFIELVDNSKDYPNTQQIVININTLLNGEMLIEGDVVKLPYRIRSENNIKNLRANLVDYSQTANWWLNLTNQTTTDLVVLKDYVPSTEGEGNVYEGVLEFTIDNSELAYCGIQLYDEYFSDSDTSELYTLEFLPLEK